MDRRDFIRRSCTACLSLTAASTLLGGCAATSYVSGRLDKDGLLLSKDDFKLRRQGGTAYASFVIVRNEALKYPVCVFRESERRFTALWMQCTHHGAELQASGDVLQCPAHGSEFTSSGAVKSGPAGKALRSFPVTLTGNEIFVDLRKPS